MNETRWRSFPTPAALHEFAAAETARAARDALPARSVFRIVLAGGSTPLALYRKLVSLDTDWSRWDVYFGDERCLPAGGAGRNDRMAREALLDRVAIPRERVHAMPAELGPIEGARAYARTLAGVGDFDLVLLGLGEDGHTASLFPGRDPGASADAPDVLAVLDAPKPPSERVSMSAARLGRSREVLFLVTGEAKREAVRQWREGAAIPAASVRCNAGVDVLVEEVLLRGQGALLAKVRARAAAKSTAGPSAARSQDFLYGDDGLPG